MMNSLRRSLLLLALLPMAASAAATAYTWPATTEPIFVKKVEKKDGKDTAVYDIASWMQVEVLDEGQLVLATRWDWYDRKNIGNPAFKPVLDQEHAFDIAIPLLKLVKKNSTLSKDKKSQLTMFDAQPTPYWLYVRFKDDAKGIKPARSVKKDKFSDDFQANRVPGKPFYSVLWKGVEGMSDKGLPTTDKDIRVAVNPLTAPPIVPKVAGPAAPFARVSELSDYEKYLLGSLAKECPAANESCRPQLRKDLQDYVAKVDQDAKADALGSKDFSPSELLYLRRRLGAEYATFEAWRKLHAGIGGAREADFRKDFKQGIKSEVDAYLGTPNAGVYNPDVTLRNVREQMAGMGAVPGTPLAVAIYAKLPGGSYRDQNRRKILEAYYGTPEKFEAEIKTVKPEKQQDYLRKQAGGIALAVLDPKKTASWIDKKGLANVKNAKLPNETFLSAFCGEVPPPPKVSIGGNTPKGPDAKETLISMDAAAHKDAQSNEVTAVNTNGVVDNASANWTPTDDQERLCRGYWTEKYKQSQYTPDKTAGGSAGRGGATGIDKMKIGSDTGEKAQEDTSKDTNRDFVAGVKMGIWAAVIGGILGGPLGLVLLGAVGMAAGWFISHQINS